MVADMTRPPKEPPPSRLSPIRDITEAAVRPVSRIPTWPSPRIIRTPNYKLTVLAAAVALSVGLSACGGGGSSSTTMPEEPTPTAYEMALAAIMEAETAAAAQQVVDNLDADDVSGAELNRLNMAIAQRTLALAEAEAKERRDMLVAAAACTDATAACVAAHNALVAALQADVDALAEDEGATNAQQAAAQMALDEATAARDAVAMAMADVDRTTETGMKVGAAIDAANGLADDRSAEAIQAAKAAIEEAEEAIGDDDSYDERITMAKTAVARAEELNAIDMAVMDARTAVEGLASDADGDAVAAVQALLNAAKQAVDGNQHLMEAEEDAHNGVIALLQVTVDKAQARVDDEAERMAAEEAEEQRKANEAMAATAAKLYTGISAQMGSLAADGTGFAANDRDAAYNADGTAINLSIGGETAPIALTATLSEDKKTTVAAHHGWEGKRYTHSVTSGDDKGDMYEAVVYSDVGMPTMGAKFNGGASGDGAVGFDLDSGTTDTVTMTAELNVGSRIASPRFTHTAGNYTPTLPDPNPTTASTIPIPGTYYGVAGTYTCTPATGSCTVAKATEGYTFATPAAWTFKATNPAARVTEMADSDYSSYGWWLYTAADGSLTASAFVDDKGTAPTTNITNLVAGSATYVGGAAGKYALSSSTGGTNDAGHFTARATLQADFEDDEVTGTIDQFMGADGMSRDWTVELKKSALFNDGAVIGDPARDGINLTAAPVADDEAQATVWTIDGTAAAAGGEWSGALKDTAETETDTTGVPKVATGTFYTEYGTAGKMVGAFGANKQ